MRERNSQDIAAILPARLPAPIPPSAEFAKALAELGVELDAGDIEKLGSYLALVLQVNESMNLTAIRDVQAAWMKHILDSLTLMPVLSELAPGSRVIDVGSGAGMPGLPLAIAMPELRFDLLEATGKKAEFLRHAIKLLGLSNAAVVHDRAERAGHNPALRESYDAVCARAVGELRVLAELTVPLAKVGSPVLLIKGEKAGQELADAGNALADLRAAKTDLLPTPTGQIVILHKQAKTFRKYPRPDGEPARRPL